MKLKEAKAEIKKLSKIFDDYDIRIGEKEITLKKSEPDISFGFTNQTDMDN